MDHIMDRLWSEEGKDTYLTPHIIQAFCIDRLLFAYSVCGLLSPSVAVWKKRSTMLEMNVASRNCWHSCWLDSKEVLKLVFVCFVLFLLSATLSIQSPTEPFRLYSTAPQMNADKTYQNHVRCSTHFNTSALKEGALNQSHPSMVCFA